MLLPSPPGDTIADLLKEKDWTQRQFAQRMGISAKHANLLISGKARLSIDMAWRLSLVLGSTPGFWATREAQYRASLLTKIGA